MAEVLVAAPGISRPLPLEGLVRLRPPQAAALSPFTILQALVLMLVIYVFTQMFVTAGPFMFTLEVTLRYLLWPLIVLGTCVHVSRRGMMDLLDPFSLFLPFFAIGIIASLTSMDPIGAWRDLMFWLLGAAGASVVGRQLGERLVMQMLFWAFGLAMLLSIGAALLLPGIGLTADLRAGSAAWQGVFQGKNWLGFYAAMALLAALAVPGVAQAARFAVLAASMVCLYFAHSSGAVANAALLAAFLASLAVTRRLKLSVPLQAAVVALVLTLLLIAAAVFWDQILGLAGRDATLTGRTVVWELYGQRALDYWLLGAGPGSFTHLAPATADIGLGLQGLGMIQTPHNLYIAVFGEVGIFGFCAFFGAMLYLVAVLPFRFAGRGPVVLSSFCFLVLVSGINETHQVFGLGIGVFVIILLKSALGHGEGGALVATAPAASRAPAPETAYAASRFPAVLG